MDIQDLKKNAERNNIPIMRDDGMKFLCTFIQEHEEIHHILEVGTAVGYSAMKMAMVRPTIHIDTIEIDEERFFQAKQNIQENHLDKQITCFLGDAIEVKVEGDYDLIFIDAAKGQYRKHMEHFLSNSHIGTYFVFDNLNFHGMVDHPSLTHNRHTKGLIKKLRVFREWIQVDPQFSTTFYAEVGDGIAISKRCR